MLLATDLAALDHHEGTVTLIANAVNWDDTDERVDAAYDDAVARLDRMTAALAAPVPLPAASFIRAGARRPPPDVGSRLPAGGRGAPRNTSGPATPSRSWSRNGSTWTRRPTPIRCDIYRVLRATNPSPYMYLLRLPAPDGVPVAIVGSSPEALVTVRDGTVTMHPIAGTRPRGVDEEDDALLAKDLLADAKERSEHVMLVDLGRNDLGRICAPGSVRVVDFFTVERYSHVMHIVSTVTGSARRGPDRLRRGVGLFPGRNPVRRAQAARDADHRVAGAGPPRTLRRHRRLPGLRR